MSDFAAVAANPPTGPGACVANPLKAYLDDCLAQTVYQTAYGAATFAVESNNNNAPATPTPATIAQYIPGAQSILGGQVAVRLRPCGWALPAQFGYRFDSRDERY